MKVLNLYAGIGGNRKLWEDVKVTAIEWDKQIASIYQDFFPDDEVIITDAHQFLLDNFEEYDFIWSSPPCPSHSRIRNFAGVGSGQNKSIYPDMRLYEEIIFLNQVYYNSGTKFKGGFCVENVKSYYKPLIKPQEVGRHYFWANFIILDKKIKPTCIKDGSINDLTNRLNFNLDRYNNIDKRTILRNCTEPELGKLILDSYKSKIQTKLFSINTGFPELVVSFLHEKEEVK